MSSSPSRQWVRPKPPTLDDFIKDFASRVGDHFGINFDPSDEEANSLSAHSADDDLNFMIEDLREDLAHYAVERSMRLTQGQIALNPEKIEDIIEDMIETVSDLHKKKLVKLPIDTFPDGRFDEMAFIEFLDTCLKDTCEKMLGNREALDAPKRSIP